ncbi:hypothetical protein [Dyadobacter aurulentus]|uniref:hypothetical protein n=1 Tax=Dyadobacter sp. UC 10 TaxID=2605428 RepID=UPI0011F401BA|nr:hypothetical protein [Dyadobacter sp. UC 10]KAA0992766.1 hypothetical protein FXO21_22605 [Dyadobacter sp. UC 10]
MLRLKNGQVLPKVGTMLYVNEDQGFYFTDKELTQRFVSRMRPGYTIGMYKGGHAGVYTGNYHAVNGQLVSVQVDHISPLNHDGIFENTPFRNWVSADKFYKPESEGVLPAGFKIENGQLGYDYSIYPVHHRDDSAAKAAQTRRTALFLIGIGVFIYLISRK